MMVIIKCMLPKSVLQSTTMIDFYKGGDDHDQSDDVGKPSDFNLRLK